MNVESLALELQKNHRLRIPDFLTVESAEYVLENLHNATAWHLVHSSDGPAPTTYDPQQVEALTELLEPQEVLKEIIEEAPDFIQKAEEEELQELYEAQPEIFNEAPDEIKVELQNNVDIFGGGFETFELANQNVTVEERRSIVAVTSTVAISTQVRPAAVQAKTATASGGVSTPNQQRRRR